MRNRGEEGVSLVEVLVALTILGIVMAGVTATVASSLRVTSESTAVTAASGLATSSMEEALAQDFATLEDEVGTPVGAQVEQVSGRDYTVTRSVRWVSSDDTTGPCVGVAAAGDANVLLVDIEVDWAGARAADIVSQQTTVSPPVGLYDPNEGSLAIYVSDAQEPSQPVSGVQVQIDGPSGVFTTTTNADGCAVFQELDAGDYDVSVDSLGFIDIDQRVAPNVTETIGVGPGDRQTFEFRYAAAETIDVAVQAIDGGTYPDEALPLYAINTLDAWRMASVSSAAAERVTLWPDQYQFFVGGCDAADPEGLRDGTAIWTGASRQPVPSAQTDGVPGNATATIQAASIEVQWDAAWPSGVSLDAVAVSLDECNDAADTEIDLGTVTTGSPARFVLPFGSWRIDVFNGSDAIADSPVVPLSPTDTTFQPAVLDYEGNLGGESCEVPFYRGSGGSVSGQGNNFSLSLPGGIQSGDVIFVVAWGDSSQDWMNSSGYGIVRITELDRSVTVWARAATGGESTVSLSTGAGNRFYAAHAFVIADLDTGNVRQARTEFERKTDSDGTSYGPFGASGQLNVEKEDSVHLIISAGVDFDNSTTSVSIDPGAFSPLRDTRLGNAVYLQTWGLRVDPPSTAGYTVTWNSVVEERHRIELVYDPECS